MFLRISAVSSSMLGYQSVMDDEELLRLELLTMTVSCLFMGFVMHIYLWVTVGFIHELFSYGLYAVLALYPRRACAARVTVRKCVCLLPCFLPPRARNRRKSNSNRFSVTLDDY